MPWLVPYFCSCWVCALALVRAESWFLLGVFLGAHDWLPAFRCALLCLTFCLCSCSTRFWTSSLCVAHVWIRLVPSFLDLACGLTLLACLRVMVWRESYTLSRVVLLCLLCLCLGSLLTFARALPWLVLGLCLGLGSCRVLVHALCLSRRT